MVGRLISSLIHRLRGDADIYLLKQRGLRIGDNCSLQPQCIIDPSHCWLVEIGDNVTIAPRAYILAHDASTKHQFGYTRIGLVTIGDNVFIGAGAIIMPGISVGKNSVIGAYSVVSNDIPSGVVAVGNPARPVCSIEEYAQKRAQEISTTPVFEWEYTIAGGITLTKKDEMVKALRDNSRVGYVR